MKRIFLALTAFLFTISALSAAEPIVLFNGQNLEGWEPVLDKPNADPADTWSVKDGLLHCTGTPRGYLRTASDDYEDYRLVVEWRWPKGTKDNANNGVLVHTSTPGVLGIWPKSLEVQMGNGNAGDFWVIPGAKADDPTTVNVPLKGLPHYKDRIRGRRHLNFTEGSEKPIGQWNRMEVVCQDDTVTVVVNGEVVNYGYDCSIDSGAICLQSEGAPIAYRKVVLFPLDD